MRDHNQQGPATGMRNWRDDSLVPAARVRVW
jgi:hypothetical protein